MFIILVLWVRRVRAPAVVQMHHRRQARPTFDELVMEGMRWG